MAKKENEVYKVLDVYIDMNNEYECICDVPNDIRIYNELPNANSMFMECPTKKSYDSIIEEFETQPHILYATGTPK